MVTNMAFPYVRRVQETDRFQGLVLLVRPQDDGTEKEETIQCHTSHQTPEQAFRCAGSKARHMGFYLG